MAHVIIPGTVTATLIMPDFENGNGSLPVTSIAKQDSADQPRSVAPGVESDIEPIAQAVIHYLRDDRSGALKGLLAVGQQSRTPDLLAALGYIQTELGH